MSEPVAKSVTPLEGKTSLDDKMIFEPERLSYRAADRVATAIADEVKASLDKTFGQTVFVLAGSGLLADFANLVATGVVLGGLKSDYNAVKEAADALGLRRPASKLAQHTVAKRLVATLGGIAPIAVGVQAALGLVSLFREDVDYRGAKTVVDSDAFDLALAGKLKDRGAQTVIVPVFSVFTAPIDSDASVTGALTAAQHAKAEAWSSIAPFVSDLVTLDAEMSAAVAQKDQAAVDTATGKISELRRNLDPITGTLGKADKRFSDLETDWNKTDEATGLTMLARLLRAENIRQTNGTYLHAAVVSSGGHHRTSRSLWRMIFLGDGLSAMGGVVIRWALLDRGGAVMRSGIIDARDGARFPTSFLPDGGVA